MARTTHVIRATPEHMHKVWEQHVLKCRENITRIENLPALHGQKWRDSMISYWQRNLDELLANEPQITR